MKIAFFDIDGTIYSSNKGKVSLAVKQAIAKAQSKGWICCVASGRSYGFLPQEIRDMSFDAYICCNGAVLLYKDQLLIHNTIPEDVVKDLVKHLEAGHIEYDLQKWDHTNLDASYTNLKNYFIASGISPSSIQARDDCYRGVVKIEMWMNKEADYTYALEKSEHFSYEVHSSTNHLEYFCLNSSKDQAASYLMDQLSCEKSYSFGDSMNDYPLAQIVDYPIAMDNAVDSLKEIAKEIAPSCDHDGVAQVLNRLLSEEVEGVKDGNSNFRMY